ncbi:putative leucine-rich repeat receptor-like protein kinase At2g19210, partial [Triticum aestivum]|uniref:putative leucine-rich repeat receptor-like protein kinase At2g19210 n=1 Tax=Triticum aestivum TaxID=4565 RepID=UPI001D006DE7
MVISFSYLAITRQTWILALLLIRVMVTRVYGQSTSVAVSIDCGNSSTGYYGYSDATTGIVYSSDSGFVEGGLSHNILEEFMAGAANEQQKTLRSFPESSRNCYTLRSTTGMKFLLRAMFTYGNYDGLNKSMDGTLFLFGLHIGVNFWEAVNLTGLDPSRMVWKEMITVAQ